MRKHTMFLFLLLLTAVQFCSADLMKLTASGGGTYHYELVITEPTIFVPGDTITLSGLSSVTGGGAGSPATLFFDGGSNTPPGSYTWLDIFPGTLTAPSTLGGFFVFSTVLSVGPVDFSIETFNLGTETGSTQGPVATPEPSSLLLLGTGLLGLAGAMRRVLLRGRHRLVK